MLFLKDKYFSFARVDKCPSGGTGIRARLKIVSRKGCGFDSHLGHIKYFKPNVNTFVFSILVFEWESNRGLTKSAKRPGRVEVKGVRSQ